MRRLCPSGNASTSVAWACPTSDAEAREPLGRGDPRAGVPRVVLPGQGVLWLPQYQALNPLV